MNTRASWAVGHLWAVRGKARKSVSERLTAESDWFAGLLSERGSS